MSSLVTCLHHSAPISPQCPLLILAAPAPPSPPRPVPVLFPPNHGRSAAALAPSAAPRASVWRSPGPAQSHAAPVPRSGQVEQLKVMGGFWSSIFLETHEEKFGKQSNSSPTHSSEACVSTIKNPKKHQKP